METKQITKQNYQKILDTIIDEIKSTSPSNKPTLLLHACCAPCSSYVIEYLSQYFDITILATSNSFIISNKAPLTLILFN